MNATGRSATNWGFTQTGHWSHETLREGAPDGMGASETALS
jgi:hypothetical protein